MAASAMSGRLTLSDPLVKELAQASCVHETYYDVLPKLQGEANWQEWSDALQHAALMAGTDAVLNGELKHPQSLEGKQCTVIEWNDSIKRTAIWRARNESLLKAMRGAADIDFANFGASNAHDTYVSLRSRYHTSDNQQAFELFSEELVLGYEFDYSPEEFAYELEDAFNRYNQLVGENVEQRLPENFLKMALLNSLGSDYHDWCKALLRERHVLALGHGSTVTFDELVDLAIVERTRLLQERARGTTSTSVPPPPQEGPKRDISQVEEPALSNPHRPCSVPHHSNSDHTNQVCMVQNPRLRFLGWKPSKADETWLAEHPEIEHLQVSNITQPTRMVQQDLRRPCSLPHHGRMRHTDQACWTQNPQLRRRSWRPSEADQRYLATHPEIEDPQLRAISLKSFDESENEPEDEYDDDLDDDSRHVAENGTGEGFEGASEIEVESGSENGHESEQETPVGGRYSVSISDQDAMSEENDANDHNTESGPPVDTAWERFVAARFAEVQAQMDTITRVVGGIPNSSKKVHENAPVLESLTGEWLLYSNSHYLGQTDHYCIRLQETTTEKQKRSQPHSRKYEGTLAVGPRGRSDPFTITKLMPAHRVMGRWSLIHFRRLGEKSYTGRAIFWGKGKMLVSFPPAVFGITDTDAPWLEFAGLHAASPSLAHTKSDMGNVNQSRNSGPGADTHSLPSERPQRNGHVEAALGYDRIIRTDRSASLAVKVEKEDSDTNMDDDDQESTAVVVKTEEPESSHLDDGRVDDVTSIMDTVQKQKDSLRAGLVVPLQYLPGVWSFHSPDYKQEPGQDVEIFFYDCVDHDSAERKCAPGHCKSSTETLRFCGELRFKAKKGERDWSCRLRQFDVPKQASVDPVRIQSLDTRSKRLFAISAWFLGGDAMSMSIEPTFIPGYKYQKKNLITFSGIKRG